jgi:hypothetical protein
MKKNRERVKPADADGLDPFFSVKAIAWAWDCSPQLVRRIFEKVPGVLRIPGPDRGGRKYHTIRIPRSIYGAAVSKMRREGRL